MPLGKDDRRLHLARRPWTQRERRVVWRGLTGRFAIAIEPLLGAAFFGLLTWGIVWRAHATGHPDLVVLAPVFGFTAVGFLGYLIAVLFAPIRAYAQTFKPIYVLDGYVRYRGPDIKSEIDGSGYVAALFADRGLAYEWECLGKAPLPEKTIPALVEFSEYGGLHRIDGRATGVLPEVDLPLLAIGIASGR